jgi:predicted XRE-type DNA-binding protein
MVNLYTIFNIINMEEENSLMQEERKLLNIAKQKLATILKNESEKGMCQKYLAKILGIDQPKISMAMKAQGSLSLSRIICLLGRLDRNVVIDTREKEIEKIFMVIDHKSPTYIMEHWASKNIM